MARSSKVISQRIELTGDAEIKAQFKALGDAGERAFKAIRIAADKSGSDIGARFDTAIAKFRRNLAQLQATSARVSAAIANLQSSLLRFGGSLATVAARLGLVTTAAAGLLAIFIKLGKSTIDIIDAADRQAQALGLGIQSFTGLAAAAEQFSISQDEFVAAMTRLNSALGKGVQDADDLGDAIDGAGLKTKGAADALRKIGIAVTDAQGNFRKTDDILLDIADKFSQMPDGIQKTALAVQLFGRAGARLIPFLNEGRKGIRGLIEDASKMGVVFTEEQKRIAAFGDQGLDRLAMAVRGARLQIGLLFAPIIGEGANQLADFIRDNIALLREFGHEIIQNGIKLVFDFIQAFLRFDDEVDFKWVLDFRDGLFALGEAARFAIFDVLIPAFNAIKAAADGVAGAINEIFGTEFTGQQVLVIAALIKLSGVLSLIVSAFGVVTGAINLFMAAGHLMAPLLATLTSGFALLARGVLLLLTGLAGLIGLPAIVTAAIVATVAAAAVAIYVYFDDIKAAAADAWGFVSAEATRAFQDIQQNGLQNSAAGQIWESIKQGSADAFAYATLQAQAFINTTLDLVNSIPFLSDWLSQFANFFTTAEGLARTFATRLSSLLTSAIEGIITAVEKAITAFNRLFSAQSSAKSTNNSGFKATALNRAAGGAVYGPGTGTSDSIPAWLSNGEFVIRAAAVRRYGMRFFSMLNAMRLSPEVFPRFRDGGFVQALSRSFVPPSFALGGPVMAPAMAGAMGGRPVILQLPGGQQIRGFTATESAISQLGREAVHAKQFAAGRRQTFIGK